MKLLDSLKQLISNQQVRQLSFEKEDTDFSLANPPFGATVKRSSKGIRLRIRRTRFWPSVLLIFVMTIAAFIFNEGWHFEKGAGPLLITMGAAFVIFFFALLYNLFGQEEFTINKRFLIRKLGLFGIGFPHKVPLRSIERIGFRHRMPKSGWGSGNQAPQIDSDRDLSSMRVLMVIGKQDEITVRDLSLAHYDYLRFFLQTTIKARMEKAKGLEK